MPVLVLLLHGGFWRAAFDRAHLGPLAAALAGENFVVCTAEFRRTGQPGGGWPGTFDDVAAAVDVLPGLARSAVPGADADGWPVVLAGHSAGGHLALWAAGRHRLGPHSPWYLAGGPRGVGVAGVVALAPVSDLAACYRDSLTRLVLLFDHIVDGLHHVCRSATPAHGNLCLVKASYVLNRFCARHLSGAEILDEKPCLGVGPERAVEKITWANCIHLDAILDQFQCKGLS